MVRSLRLTRGRDIVLNQQMGKQDQKDKNKTKQSSSQTKYNHQTKCIPVFINDFIITSYISNTIDSKVSLLLKMGNT